MDMGTVPPLINAEDEVAPHDRSHGQFNHGFAGSEAHAG
jgi:hypothetical protein